MQIWKNSLTIKRRSDITHVSFLTFCCNTKFAYRLYLHVTLRLVSKKCPAQCYKPLNTSQFACFTEGWSTQRLTTDFTCQGQRSCNGMCQTVIDCSPRCQRSFQNLILSDVTEVSAAWPCRSHNFKAKRASYNVAKDLDTIITQLHCGICRF